MLIAASKSAMWKFRRRRNCRPVVREIIPPGSVNFGPRNFMRFQLKQTLTWDSHFARSHGAILPRVPESNNATSEFCCCNASDAPQRPHYSQEIASNCPHPLCTTHIGIFELLIIYL